MKTLARFLTAALLIGATVPALAQTTLPMNPEQAIPDNLPRMTSPGPYDDFIKQVQEKLNELRFDAGPVNGDFGSKTQAALGQFQLAHLLPASGALDDATLRALDIQRPGQAEASAPQDGDNAAAGSTAPADAR
jgi:peptidoglycan hydrolase-like protein with peptidoglycan-binding domain